MNRKQNYAGLSEALRPAGREIALALPAVCSAPEPATPACFTSQAGTPDIEQYDAYAPEKFELIDSYGSRMRPIICGQAMRWKCAVFQV